ncbi:hypothetical protein CPB86DRAFT_782920 [Serendipita vermifera]|nr:hypothetical protein CPB86DRAFT_782920 [Serendipita vermifera]
MRIRPSPLVPPSHLFETLSRLETTTDNVLGDLESLLKSTTPDQANKFAMKAFNAVAGAIAAVHKAGRTVDGDSSPIDQGKLSISIDASVISLGVLRQSFSLSTERAALSLASRLISLKCYEAARTLLKDVKRSLTSNLPVSSTQLPSNQSSLEFVCMKVDGRVSSLDSDSLNTGLTYLSCAFQVFLQPLDGMVRFKEDMDLLSGFIQANGAGTFLSWTRDLEVIDVERLLPMATTIMKSVETSSGLLSPVSAITLRFYALQCTADVSFPNKLSWVWKHALNVSASYIKTAAPRKKEEFNPLNEGLKSLIGLLQSRGQHNTTLFNEEPFTLLCREWSKLALRVKDSSSIDFIQSLLPYNAQESKASTEIDILEFVSQKTRDLEVCLQSKDINSLRQNFTEITSCLERFQLERINDNPFEYTNLFQTIERLRRRMKSSIGIQKEQELATMLQRSFSLISGLYDSIIQLGKVNDDCRVDVITAAVENRILTSKLQINLNLVDSYEPTYQSLLEAQELVNNLVKDTRADDRVSDLWRCLSGAFWNIGASIYQSGRWDHSVPFISGSVDVDRRLLGAERRLSQGKNDSWDVFYAQMPKRMLLLAGCFIKLGDRKGAYQIFLDSLRYHLKTLHGELQSYISSVPASLAFQDSRFSPIKVIIEKATHLGVFELFLGEEIILRSLVESLHFPPAVIGAILECQIDYLERFIWKEEVPELVESLLSTSSRIYSDNHPVRHARLLGRRLEYIYYMKQPWKDAEDAGTKAIILVSNQTSDSDANISIYKQQYLLKVYLWLIFNAHLHGYHELMSDYIKASLKVTAYTTSRDTQAIPKASKAGKRSVRAPKSVPRPQVLKGPQSDKDPHEKSRSRALKKETTVKLHLSDAVAGLGGFLGGIDRPDEFWRLMEMSWNFYGALGQIKQKVAQLTVCSIILRERRDNNEMHVKALTELAYEYGKMGRLQTANKFYTDALEIIKSGNITDTIKLMFLLRFSSTALMSLELEKSNELYKEAQELYDSMEWSAGENASSLEKARLRIYRYLTVAQACSAYSDQEIENYRPVLAMESLMQCLRIWNTAISITHAFISKSEPKAPERNPFAMEEVASALPSLTPSLDTDLRGDSARKPSRSLPDDWQWYLAGGLTEIHYVLSEYHFLKGNFKDAEYFAKQARQVAESIHALERMLKAEILLADIQLHRGRLSEADNLLASVETRMSEAESNDLSAVDLLRVRGLFYDQTYELDNASTSYTKAEGLLLQFDKTVEQIIASYQTNELKEAALGHPYMAVRVILPQAWLARDGSYNHLLAKADELPATVDINSGFQSLKIRLAYHQALKEMQSDLTVGSLLESAILLPMEQTDVSSAFEDDTLNDLRAIEDNAWLTLKLLRERGFTSEFRDIAFILTSVITLQQISGNGNATHSNMIAFALDAAVAPTLRRELLECIQIKVTGDTSKDVLEWPTSTVRPTGISRPGKGLRLEFPRMIDEDSSSENHRSYWLSIKERYQKQSLLEEAKLMDIGLLPKNWTVVIMCMPESRDTLYVSRIQMDQEPQTLRLPLIKDDKLEHNGKLKLSFDDAMAELKDIITSGNLNGQTATQIANQDKTVRAAWWNERASLDSRLQVLLENIEFCWLGPFKFLLDSKLGINDEIFKVIDEKLQAIFAAVVGTNSSEFPLLGRTVLECFASLSPKCRIEELEDLVYIIMDIYSLRGYHFDSEKMDIQKMVANLRNLRMELASLLGGCNLNDNNEHIFLVLDKIVQEIPWESVPSLRKRSVSRIPSLSFLIDRLKMAALQQSNRKFSQKSSQSTRMPLDPRKVYYVLNPEGDLKRTENAFTPWLKQMKNVGWNGIIGRKPTEFELSNALSTADLFIYFGHGGAEQYIRGSKVRSLLRCSSVMLWGCSSGAMEEAGRFDRLGTPYNYLLGGCPLIVANLWDVTDRDIDKFAQAVFNKLELEPEKVKRYGKGEGVDGISVVTAVSESRDACKLKYLTGAAPVVYGIPFYL